jgi:Ni,Fe-hydrogenase III large subunit/Ni,Fe-hydrogenase III component G
MTQEQIIAKFVPHDAEVSIFGNLIAYKTSATDIVSICLDLYKEKGLSLKIITAFDERSSAGAFKIMYVFGLAKEDFFLAPYILSSDDFPSLTPFIHEASIYERKIHTFFGLNPVGHPDLRTLILHENWPAGVFPLRKDFDWQTRPADGHSPFRFRQIRGEGIYEIPVGPVHAGIIEPGHFRFSMAGEEILMLEPRLGYSHKGSEKLFEVLPLREKVRLSERISGDSSFSHSLAFCQAAEKISNTKVSERDKYARVIFAELERLACHLGDIGFILSDTGFNFGGAQGSRLREIVMRINESLTGSRFLRGVNKIGGVTVSISETGKDDLLKKLPVLEKDFTEVVAIATNSRTVLNRLNNTGRLDKKIAADHGVVGVPARAVGLAIDTRLDHPYAAYGELNLDISTETAGDVHARFQARVKEVYTAIRLITQALEKLTVEQSNSDSMEPVFAANAYSISLVEGWRGEIVYLISTNTDGEISRVDVRDPSFLNWTALGHAGPGNIVADFPLINKSFNLSYSGNDI